MGTGVINSSLLPLVYYNRIVEHLMGVGGLGLWVGTRMDVVFTKTRVL